MNLPCTLVPAADPASVLIQFQLVSILTLFVQQPALSDVTPPIVTRDCRQYFSIVTTFIQSISIESNNKSFKENQYNLIE